MRGTPSPDAVANIAARKAQDATDVERALERLDRAAVLREKFPGVSPTAGAATGDPGYLAMEADALRHRTGTGPTPLDAVLAKTDSDAALVRALAELRPRSELGDIGDMRWGVWKGADWCCQRPGQRHDYKWLCVRDEYSWCQ